MTKKVVFKESRPKAIGRVIKGRETGDRMKTMGRKKSVKYV